MVTTLKKLFITVTTALAISAMATVDYFYDLSQAQWTGGPVDFFAVFDTPFQYSPESDFTYVDAGGTATITAYVGSGGQVNIPPTLGGLPVHSIGVNAFIEKTAITGLTLPEGLVEIQTQAFKDCSGLRGNLVIPSTCTSIGYSSFARCGFDGTLTLPPSLSVLDINAFVGCSSFTGSLIIPYLGASPLSAGVFSGCSGFSGDLVIPNDITSLGAYAFFNCSGLNGTVTIPDSVTSIGDYCFMQATGVSRMIIGSGVSYIGMWAFRQTSDASGSVFFRGLTAPTLDTEVFSYRTFTVAYIRPGATGYGTVPGSFGGVPTVEWSTYPDLP